MKRFLTMSIALIIISFISIGCGGDGNNSDSSDSNPSGTSVCTIDGQQIPLSVFKRAYKLHLDTNYREGQREIMRDDRDEMKKYFNGSFLPQELFYKYALKLDIFKNKKILKRAKNYFNFLGLTQYSIYSNVSKKYKEPSDNELKRFYNELKQSQPPQLRAFLKKIKKLKWNKKRLQLLNVHKQFLSKKLLAQYVDKIRQENRVILNDDMEKNLIKKFINDEISMDKILKDTKKKYWLLKFNKKVVTAGEVERVFQLILLLNYGKKKLDDYLKKAKTRKSLRKFLWRMASDQWLVYLQAIKKGFDKDPKSKVFLTLIEKSSFSKLYLAKKIAKTVPRPTDKEIKAFYNKQKRVRPNLPALNDEVKKYIAGLIKRQKSQLKMMKFFNKLKGRHVIITNDKVFVNPEEETSTSTQS